MRNRTQQRSARVLSDRHGITYQQALSQLDDVPASDMPVGDTASWCLAPYPGEPVTLPLTDEVEQEIEGWISENDAGDDWEVANTELLARVRQLRSRGVTAVQGTCEDEIVWIMETPHGRFAPVYPELTDYAVRFVCVELTGDREAFDVPVRLFALPALPGDHPPYDAEDGDFWSFDILIADCRCDEVALPGRRTVLRRKPLLPPIPSLVAEVGATETLTEALLAKAVAAGITVTARICGAQGEIIPGWADKIMVAAIPSDSDGEWCRDLPPEYLFAIEEGATINLSARRDGKHTIMFCSDSFEVAALRAIGEAADGLSPGDDEPNMQLVMA